MVQARCGYYIPHEKNSNSRSCWDLEWEGQWVRVIYSKEHKHIITFLPLPVDDEPTPIA
jgi:hypothetical protein